ncbi:hypothetical protein MGH68_15420 [Erysipelothrix sp. D19-032]
MTKNGKFVLKSLLMKGLAIVSVIGVGLYTSPYSVVFAKQQRRKIVSLECLRVNLRQYF